nr:unnamed protein product [Callosobruchus chinensis]
MFFQQDGATCHTANGIIELLSRLHTIRQACQFELNSPPEDRSPERVYIPVDLTGRTVQVAGEKSKICSFIRPA